MRKGDKRKEYKQASFVLPSWVVRGLAGVVEAENRAKGAGERRASVNGVVVRVLGEYVERAGFDDRGRGALVESMRNFYLQSTKEEVGLSESGGEN